jgi:RNA polymerase sigma-70 factor, ECF subfamily
MLLHDSRREARLDEEGNLMTLEDQDRTRWNARQINEAMPLVDEALRGAAGPYTIEAAISAVHCRATRAADTDWKQIVRLYDLLQQIMSSPVVSLNRAVAVAMADRPEAGLRILDQLETSGELRDYHLFHAARADLLRRQDSREDAARSYKRALELVTNDSERKFLEKRLMEVESHGV